MIGQTVTNKCDHHHSAPQHFLDKCRGLTTNGATEDWAANLGAAERVMKREHMLSMVIGVLSVLALSSLGFAAKDRFELKAPQAVAGLVR